MRKFSAIFILFAVISVFLASCFGGNLGETAVTAPQDPADSGLSYQAALAVDESSDYRLISAAKSFCGRTHELSQGSVVFNLILSKNVLGDLRSGKADAILLENAEIPEFSPMSEAFRYKSYEHFSMTANSAETLRKLSDILGANVFAGFYAGSDIFLSRGTLDSKCKPFLRRNADEAQETVSVSVTTLTNASTRAFSLLGADVTEVKELDTRITLLSQADSAVEFLYSELDSPALLEAIRADALKIPSMPAESDGENGGEDAEPVSDESEPLVITRALTGIKPVWLVFKPSSCEKLSQANRAAVAEAAAYMVSDIDGVYLKYEQEKINLLAEEDVASSREFTVTRAQVLRLADERTGELTKEEQRLREIITRIQ